MSCWSVAAIAAAVLLAQPATSQADSAVEQAAALAEEAAILGRAGKLEWAIQKFKEAERLDPRANRECNIGLAYFRLKKWPQAQLFLSRCRDRWSTEETRPIAEWVNRRIRETVTRLERGDFLALRIDSSPQGAKISLSTLEDDEHFEAPRYVWVPYGQVELRAQAEGHALLRKTLEVRAKSNTNLMLSLEALTEGGGTPGETNLDVEDTQAKGSSGGDLSKGPSTSKAPATRSHILPWALSGSGLALLGAGLATTSYANSASDKANEFLDDEEQYELWNGRFETRATFAYAFYGVGGAALAAGLYLLISRDALFAPPGETQLSLEASKERVGMSVSWGWL